MTIRAATAADARSIAEVHISSWKTSYRGVVPDARLDALSLDSAIASWGAQLESMQAPDCCFVTEDHGGAITGFSQAGQARGAGLGTDGEIYAIYLIQSAQRKGAGRALMHRTVQHLRDAGFRSVGLWLLRDNPARGFYQRFGGLIAGEKPYTTGGFTLPAIGCIWDDINVLLGALQPV